MVEFDIDSGPDDLEIAFIDEDHLAEVESLLNQLIEDYKDDNEPEHYSQENTYHLMAARFEKLNTEKQVGSFMVAKLNNDRVLVAFKCTVGNPWFINIGVLDMDDEIHDSDF
jgi:hypothetical protein